MFENKKLKTKKVDKKELKIGIVISVVAWCIPYLYVIFFGQLPIGLWIIFIVFVLVMGMFFVKKLRDKVSRAKKL
jgi:Mg/Co/Ni transporter MgtE